MPASRLLSDYPAEYTDLFHVAALTRVEMPFPDRQSAKQLRERLYAFRRAVLSDENIQIFPELTLIITTVRLSIEGTTLVAEPVEERDQRERIFEAIKSAREPGESAETSTTPPSSGLHDDG